MTSKDTDDAFFELMEGYTMTVPLIGWYTADLVKLSLLIDTELQRRASEEPPYEELV
jgi:hypothetical protein